MQKVKQIASIAAASGLALAALASNVLAQYYDYTYGTTSTTTPATAADGAFGLVFIVCWCCVVLFALLVLAFSVWMLVDALKRTEAALPNKLIWVLAILFTSGIGSVAYFFMVKKKLDKGLPVS